MGCPEIHIPPLGTGKSSELFWFSVLAGVLAHPLSQEDVVGLEAAAGGGRMGEAIMEKVGSSPSPQVCS